MDHLIRNISNKGNCYESKPFTQSFLSGVKRMTAGSGCKVGKVNVHKCPYCAQCLIRLIHIQLAEQLVEQKLKGHNLIEGFMILRGRK